MKDEIHRRNLPSEGKVNEQDEHQQGDPQTWTVDQIGLFACSGTGRNWSSMALTTAFRSVVLFISM